MTPEKQNNGMRSMARDMSGKRTWQRRNNYTTMVSVRLPNWLADRLRAYVDYTGTSITDVVVVAVDEVLKKYSPMERLGGKEEEGED